MKTVSIERDGPIAYMKMNRPEILNALDAVALEEILELLEQLAKETQIKALIITGRGDRAFIAGADIKAMQNMSHLQMMEFLNLGQKVSNAFENAPFVTFAAVNGYALGGGFEMALACDFIYASSTAKFGLPEITLGIIPGFGGTQRLAKAIGPRLAKEMILNGKIINAEEAKALGIVNQICDPEFLIQSCTDAAKRIIKFSSVAIQLAKKAVQRGTYLSLEDGLELEKNMCAVCFDTPERVEAMEVFINKKGAR